MSEYQGASTLDPFVSFGDGNPSSHFKPSNFEIMNTENNLTFVSTSTLAEFKAAKSVSSLDIVKNPKTEKIFFSCSSTSGAVSSKWTSKEPSMISVVKGEDSVEFFMLHNKASVNVIETI